MSPTKTTETDKNRQKLTLLQVKPMKPTEIDKKRRFVQRFCRSLILNKGRNETLKRVLKVYCNAISDVDISILLSNNYKSEYCLIIRLR